MCSSDLDFNGDGKPDLVWQHDTAGLVSVWYMGDADGSLMLGWNSLASVPSGWRVVATGDFNEDGKPDLVWQHDTAGFVSVWYMSGASGNVMLGWNPLPSVSVAGWRVVGAADFNGDGKPDLVWQHDTARMVSVWYMGGAEGNVMFGWNYLSSTGVPGWRATVR